MNNFSLDIKNSSLIIKCSREEKKNLKRILKFHGQHAFTKKEGKKKVLVPETKNNFYTRAHHITSSFFLSASLPISILQLK